ncbi:MAG: response regulator [Bdellovibrionales bacterium]
MKKRVLVVEDDKDMADMVKARLQSSKLFQIEVTNVFDGVSASQEVEYNPFDLIITDLMMPRKSGDSFIKRARFSKLNTGTPIIVISGNLNYNLAKDYAPVTLIEKPYRISDLKKTAEKTLAMDKELFENSSFLFPHLLTAIEKSILEKSGEILSIEAPLESIEKSPFDAFVHQTYELDHQGKKMKMGINMERSFVEGIYIHFTGNPLPDSENDISMISEEFYKIVISQFRNILCIIGEEIPQISNAGLYFSSAKSDNSLKTPGKSLAIKVQTNFGNLSIENILPMKPNQSKHVA